MAASSVASMVAQKVEMKEVQMVANLDGKWVEMKEF